MHRSPALTRAVALPLAVVGMGHLLAVLAASVGAGPDEDAAAPGPAAALTRLADTLRCEAPDADAVSAALLWTRWGFEGADEDLYGDLRGLFSALTASKSAPDVVVTGDGGKPPHRHATCTVAAAGKFWRVVVVEEDGWRLARAVREGAEAAPEPNSEPKTPAAGMAPSAGALPLPPAPKEDLYAVAESVLAAIDARDTTVLAARFVDARGGTPKALEPSALERVLASLHEKYGGRPRVLGATSVRGSGGRAYHAVPVRFGESGDDADLAWLLFGAAEDGRAYLADVAEGDVADFTPRKTAGGG